MNQEAWQKVETAIAATKDTTIKQLFAADPEVHALGGGLAARLLQEPH